MRPGTVRSRVEGRRIRLKASADPGGVNHFCPGSASTCGLLVRHHDRKVLRVLADPGKGLIVRRSDAVKKTKAAQRKIRESGRDLVLVHCYCTMLQGLTLTPPSRTSK